MIKSGARGLSEKELNDKAFPVNRIVAKFDDRTMHRMVFVVNRQRGHEEYKIVRSQYIHRGKLGRYPNQLFYSMFKKW